MHNYLNYSELGQRDRTSKMFGIVRLASIFCGNHKILWFFCGKLDSHVILSLQPDLPEGTGDGPPLFYTNNLGPLVLVPKVNRAYADIDFKPNPGQERVCNGNRQTQEHFISRRYGGNHLRGP